MTSGRRRIGLMAAAVALASAVSTPAAVAGTGSREDAAGRYVALGDSYVAGPFVGTLTSHTPGCLQTDGNYPHRVAAALSITLKDVGCSSAATDHVFAPQVTDGVVLGTAPPQLAAVTADATMVSIGFGANDIKTSELMGACVSLFPIGSPCQDHYVKDGVDQIALRIDATAPKFDRVISAVRTKAPHARIFVVGYPAIFPAAGGGCWPLVPVTPSDTQYLRNSFKRLNGVLAARAAAHHVTYVDTYTPSIGHDPCQAPAQRWIEPLIPAAPASVLHPNARGEQGLADALLAAVRTR
ncbi:SGNH/GDSL hydrolase family protein [Luteipulveratus mongoliensis]|uniref:SGNH/GDSL hydrolase family protein n=1 Tax=Luteipulveratus mongoliensis TaxID=571913 RepID=UPI0014703624|nr:SGNH/GDSL hydrolase family protein [Luteipulveratus mongoliensis]